MNERLTAAVQDSIATWFGCGLAPLGPGTVGSAAALGIAILLRPNTDLLSIMTATTALAGTWAAGGVARRLKREDPGLVVVDEVVGQWITLLGVTSYNWKSWIGAFILFRLFDIWKPAPVRQLERLPGGIGIMADDVMAGVYGALVIFVLGRFKIY